MRRRSGIWILTALLTTTGCQDAEPPSAPDAAAIDDDSAADSGRRYLVHLLGAPPPLPGQPGFTVGAQPAGPFGDGTPPVSDLWEPADLETWAFALNEHDQVAGIAYSNLDEAPRLEGAAVFRYGHEPRTWELAVLDGVRAPYDPHPKSGGGLDRVHIDEAGTVYFSASAWMSQAFASEFLGPPGFPPTHWDFRPMFEGYAATRVTAAAAEGTAAVNLLDMGADPSVWPRPYTAALVDASGTPTIIAEDNGFVSDVNADGTALVRIEDAPGSVVLTPGWYVWSQGTFQAPPVGLDLSVNARLNDHGDIVDDELLLVDGELVDLTEALEAAGLLQCRTKDLNNHGHVVGFGWEHDFFDNSVDGWPLDEAIPFVVEDGVVHRLADRIDQPLWKVTHAYAINDAGRIAGAGLYQGRRRACLLVPVED